MKCRGRFICLVANEITRFDYLKWVVMRAALVAGRGERLAAVILVCCIWEPYTIFQTVPA